MKKMGCCFLSIILIFYLCTLPIQAIEIEIKEIEMYDYYETKNKTVSLCFQGDVPYIEPSVLASLTDYEYIQQDEKMLFKKQNGLQTTKLVSIDEGKIQYGSYKDKIKQIEFEDVTYIELIPTIDYLDSRLRMSPDGRMILFSAEKTFSQLVNQVNYDLLHGGNIEENVDSLESGAAWLWLLLNGKLLSSLPDERSKRLAFGLLTEENQDVYVLKSKSALVDFASTVSNDSDFVSAAGEIMSLEVFDKSLKEFGNRLKSIASFANFTYEGLSRMVNIQLQVEQLYMKNIKNVENTLLNSDMNILNKTDCLYETLKMITDGYTQNSETKYEEAMTSLYAEEGKSFIANITTDIAASSLIKVVPALDLGLSLLKVYGNISGVTDGAISAIEKKDYIALQAKVAIELQKYHNQIRKGKTLSEEGIRNYVELARMYYHVKTAYYHMYNEYHPNTLFKDNYQLYLNIEKDIDEYGVDIYTLDIPDSDSTDVSTLIFPREKKIQLTQEFKLEDFSCSIYLPSDSILTDYKKTDGSTLSYIWNYNLPYIDKLEDKSIQITIVESFQPYDGVQRNMDEYKELHIEDSNMGDELYLGNHTKFIHIIYPYNSIENGINTIAMIDFQNTETQELINYYIEISVKGLLGNDDIVFIQDLALKIAKSCTFL